MREEKRMSSWHCLAFISVLKLGNFHTYYYFSVYTHHKEQEGVALHVLAVRPAHCACASVGLLSEEAWLGFVPSTRQKRCHDRHFENDGLALMEQWVHVERIICRTSHSALKTLPLDRLTFLGYAFEAVLCRGACEFCGVHTPQNSRCFLVFHENGWIPAHHLTLLWVSVDSACSRCSWSEETSFPSATSLLIFHASSFGREDEGFP